MHAEDLQSRNKTSRNRSMIDLPACFVKISSAATTAKSCSTDCADPNRAPMINDVPLMRSQPQLPQLHIWTSIVATQPLRQGAHIKPPSSQQLARGERRRRDLAVASGFA